MCKQVGDGRPLIISCGNIRVHQDDEGALLDYGYIHLGTPVESKEYHYQQLHSLVKSSSKTCDKHRKMIYLKYFVSSFLFSSNIWAPLSRPLSKLWLKHTWRSNSTRLSDKAWKIESELKRAFPFNHMVAGWATHRSLLLPLLQQMLKKLSQRLKQEDVTVKWAGL